MLRDHLRRFFFSIALPALLAMGLFIFAIFVIILPSSERISLESKKEMITELTLTVCSLIEEYQQEVQDSLVSADSAKALAIERIKGIRYGPEKKGYFWIIDRQAILSHSQDQESKLLFEESVRTVEKSGEGFINYMWQRGDDSTRTVPILSYVREVKGWDWIVGTGMYLEDMRIGISSFKNRILWLTLGITLIISILLAIIILHSLEIERKKKNSEDALLLSREKYKSLAEAATEGTLTQFEEDQELLTGELQTLLMMMHQPLKAIAREIRQVHANASVREAIRIISRTRSNILFVNHGDNIMGVINQQDLTKRVLATGLDPDKKVIEIMTSPVVTLHENALISEGLLTMKKKGLSHIALTGANKKITGVVGFREIGGMQENMAGFLIKEISVAEGVEQLRRIYRRLPVLVKALSDSGGHTSVITRIINSVGDAIHRRLIDLAMEELGPAPCKFAFIVLGSHGRGEQTLATEQCNALITVNMQESYRKEAQLYFRELAKKINTELDALGFRDNPEEIMARNPKWRRELNGWKKYFSDWIGNSNPKDLLHTAIFFDFRLIYGEKILVEQLRTYVNKISSDQPVFFNHMARSINQMKIQVKPDDPQMNLSKMLLPVVSYIRLYAIREQLSVTGTRERTTLLRERGIFDPALLGVLMEVFDFITHLLIRNQASDISHNLSPDHMVETSLLNRVEKMILKKHLQDIAGLHTRLSGEFNSTD